MLCSLTLYVMHTLGDTLQWCVNVTNLGVSMSENALHKLALEYRIRHLKMLVTSSAPFLSLMNVFTQE